MKYLPNLAFGVDRSAGVGPHINREVKHQSQIDQASQNEFKLYGCVLRVDMFGRCWIECSWP